MKRRDVPDRLRPMIVEYLPMVVQVPYPRPDRRIAVSMPPHPAKRQNPTSVCRLAAAAFPWTALLPRSGAGGRTRAGCHLPPGTGRLAIWSRQRPIAVPSSSRDAARGRDFTTHRAFMIRSFALMNVFSLIRLADGVSFPGLSADQQRVLWEWSCMTIIVVGTEVGLTWWPALRRLRQRLQARPVGA